MYIVEYCIRYNHTCGCTTQDECPGDEECYFGFIYNTGYSLIKDRFEAREYYKQTKTYMKSIEPNYYGETSINYIKEERDKDYYPI